VDGYPIQRLPLEDAAAGRLKKGDALYFPGHIAMYIGDGKYIHSTGKIGSGGVVINSLRPEDPDFRQDLLDCLYAVGGVRL
ncbi:MAG: C40 family peptidase, partial [Lachnospiraceae bacterium]|nr:C40 family peptidase [Lachnospiraceae bacterium]